MRAWRTGVRAWLPTKTCEFDSHCPHQTGLRLSSEATRVQLHRSDHPNALAFPLRLTAGCRTLNARIVVRIHEGGANASKKRLCSSAVEQPSHTRRVGCSIQPIGTMLM